MSYVAFLSLQPLFWISLSGLCAGGAVAGATRSAARSRDPRKAHNRKGVVVPIWLAGLVASFAAGLILAADLEILAAPTLAFGGVVGLVSLVALRFPRAVGLPLVGLLTVAGLYAGFLVSGMQPVRGVVDLAEFTVLSMDGRRLALEVTDSSEPGAPTRIVAVNGPMLGATANAVDVSPYLFLLGAQRFVGSAAPVGAAPDGPADSPTVSNAVELPGWVVEHGLLVPLSGRSRPVSVNLLRSYTVTVDRSASGWIRLEEREIGLR